MKTRGIVSPDLGLIAKMRGFVGPDVGLIVKTHAFWGPDVGSIVKTRGDGKRFQAQGVSPSVSNGGGSLRGEGARDCPPGSIDLI